jgi:hypothetical protein
VLLTFAIYGSGALAASLFGDDWGLFVTEPIRGTLVCPDNSGFFNRPLQPCLVTLQYPILHLNIAAYHIVKLLLTSLVGVFLYFFLITVLTGQKLLAFIASALFVVLPTVFVQNWLIQLQLDVALILALAGMAIATKSLTSNSILSLLVSIPMFAASLMIYEVTLGLLSFFSLFFLFRSLKRHSPVLVAILPISICALYAIGRTASEMLIGNRYGYSRDEFTTSPTGLLLSIGIGYRLLLENSWSAAVDRIRYFLWGQPPSMPASLNVIALLVALLIAGAVTARVANQGNAARPRTLADTIRREGRSVMIAVSGAVAIGAAYFPVIIAATPALEWEESRFNVVANVGLATFLVGMLDVFASLTTRAQFARNLVVVVMAGVLAVVGAVSQVLVQTDSQRAWSEQRSMWGQMFSLAPDFAPNTAVLVAMLSGRDKSAASPLQSGPGAFSSALAIMYGHEDIAGSFITAPWEGPAEFHENGVALSRRRPVTSYSNVVAFEFDRQSGVLRRVEVVTPGPVWPVDTEHRVCGTACILPSPPMSVPLRVLVE